MLSAGKISCCILTEINPEFWSRPTQQKQILTGLLVTKIYNNRTMKISLFNYSLLGYISRITTPLPHIYIEEILVRSISLNRHTRLDFKHHPTQEYFRQVYHYLGPFCRFLQPGLISSTIFCKKLDFPTVNHNRYIKLHWAQFPMIGNTYKWKFLKIFIRTFCYNNKVTNEVTKRLPKLSNKEIHFTLLI